MDEVEPETGWVIEPHGDGFALYVGRNSEHHGFRLLNISDVDPNFPRAISLIAAAPELLAACKMWDQGFTDGEQFTPEQLLEWMNKNRRAARAAIAKAEGK